HYSVVVSDEWRAVGDSRPRKHSGEQRRRAVGDSRPSKEHQNRMASFTIDWQANPPSECRLGALTIGNFDGVHLGHAALLTSLREQARACAGPAVALTFDPHPLELLRPGNLPPVLTTLEERTRVLRELGADHVVILRATMEMLSLSAAEFLQKVIQHNFAAKALVEGPNFAFGHNREGTIHVLAKLASEAGIGLTVVPPIVIDVAEVSSSRIRAALLAGDVEAAARLLGRPYRLQGIVGTGQHRGATIGFPTANVEGQKTVTPGNGVYAVKTLIGSKNWSGAANVGPNPTFGEDARKVEIHVIDFHGDLYGQSLSVDFMQRLRDTKPFANVTQLVDQLHRDVETVQKLNLAS
ncbi:MAG: bifunctional riboflavin kinase/FAD synthetase, partial [Candidatus Acidiferrum sp.]